MTETEQTIAVAVIVLSAVAYLIARARRKPACGGGDCGCSTRKPQP
jgi:hypothetical protein